MISSHWIRIGFQGKTFSRFYSLNALTKNLYWRVDHSCWPYNDIYKFSPVQSLSRVRFFATPWIAARQASLSITNSWSSLKLTSIESVMPFSYLILCHPLFLLPPIRPSIRVFTIDSTLCIKWPKYWSFSFSIIPSKEHPGLISFRMDWLDLLAVQGTLRSLLQHHSSKASVLQCSAFFTVQLSHPYMTTGKTIALTRRTFVGKVMLWYKIYFIQIFKWIWFRRWASFILYPIISSKLWRSPWRLQTP